jgi:ribosomal peptide maturation radical SAM protein 1
VADKDPAVALVSMPFISVDRPSLATALLKAILRQRGVECDVHNLFISFAKRIGLLLYERLAVIGERQLAGERLFVSEVFGSEFMPQLEMPFGYDPNYEQETLDNVKRRLRESPALFIDECIENISWGQYGIVGFSSMFEQNLASLALAKRIKDRWSDIVIVFGGANCEGEMGLELHRQFPFVDYVCSGEGDKIFPELVEALLAGRPAPRAPGLISRIAGPTIVGASIGAAPVLQLDELPFPDYDDYFEQLRASSLNVDGNIDLPFETSRGCWYGAKHHCTFCGLNGDTITYRSKSPARALEEIEFLARRYGVTRMQATDNILDTRYLSELLPQLARSGPKPSLFYEIKANLRREQLAALKRAGIDRLQPGIESLSTSILQLMRKGCTALQNIQTLKWANELQIEISWNFLMGFPGEDPQEYNRIAEMIPAVLHLTPPGVIGYVRLDRFSPYFTVPDHLGMVCIRPAPPYSALYPFPEHSVRRLAYFFEYDYADGRDPREYTEPAARMMRFWQQNHCAYSFGSIIDGNTLMLRDRRPGATEATARLDDWGRAVYDFLDSAHPLPPVQRHLQKLGYRVEEDVLSSMLEDWRRKNWVIRDGDSYLALAVRMDALC